MGGREEDNLILLAVRAVPVTSAGNKHYNHTGGTAGTSHSEAAELQQRQQKQKQNKQLQGSLPCCDLLHLLFLLHSFTLLLEQLFLPFSLPFSFSSNLPEFSPTYPSPLALYLILSFVLHLLFAVLTLLFSSIMDSLEISASCSGPRSPGASQAVLIPTPEESSRQRK